MESLSLNKHLNKQKEIIQGLMELLKESLDDMPAELNQQGELTAGLVMLLKKSIASEKKATGEILRLQEDKAKLCHEIDLLKEKNAGWKKLHENSSSSMKMMQPSSWNRRRSWRRSASSTQLLSRYVMRPWNR